MELTGKRNPEPRYAWEARPVDVQRRQQVWQANWRLNAQEQVGQLHTGPRDVGEVDVEPLYANVRQTVQQGPHHIEQW